MNAVDPQFLSHCELFENQSTAVLEAIAAQGALEKLGPGAVLFQQGDIGDRLYIIKSGVLEVVVTPTDGSAAHTIVFLGVGEIVGELALLTGSPRSATIRCPESAEVFRLDVEVFNDLLTSVPGMARALCVVLASRLEASTLKSRRVEAKQLSGGLEYFDLATVIQTLIGSHQTGSLVITEPGRGTVAEILVLKGNVVRARYEKLNGDDAVFQLFQSKPSGQFAFTTHLVEEPQKSDITLSGISLLMESVRMSDELPMLQERLTDRRKRFVASGEFSWTDAETLAPAKILWPLLVKGASIEDLERDSGLCSYWAYKVVLGLQQAGRLS